MGSPLQKPSLGCERVSTVSISKTSKCKAYAFCLSPVASGMGGQSFSLKMLWGGSQAGVTFTSFPPSQSSELLAEAAVTRASATVYTADRSAASALSVALRK